MMQAVETLEGGELMRLSVADTADAEQLLLLLASIVTRMLGVYSRGETEETQAR